MSDKNLVLYIPIVHIIIYKLYIPLWEAAMKTTLNIDDELIKKASRMTGISEKTSLVRLGLETLIARESARRLAMLGGTEKNLKIAKRRRSHRE
jgi:Arc/MetJ family transcription regulator